MVSLLPKPVLLLGITAVGGAGQVWETAWEWEAVRRGKGEGKPLQGARGPALAGAHPSGLLVVKEER